MLNTYLICFSFGMKETKKGRVSGCIWEVWVGGLERLCVRVCLGCVRVVGVEGVEGGEGARGGEGITTVWVYADRLVYML